MTSTRRLDVPSGIVTITPNDSTNLTKPIRGFMVGVTGTVAVIMEDGTTGTYPNCVAGTHYDGLISRVKATGTTATSILGFY